MTFDDMLAQVIALLQRQGRVSYGALKRRFGLDDAYLDDLKAELIDAQRLAVDEQGRVLVWRGPAGTPSEDSVAPPAPLPTALPDAPPPPAQVPPILPPPAEAERRQLTVMFCDLVDSTTLAGQMDPEDLRAVIHAYHTTCAEVIQRFDGQIAQYLGDGLLVYFGYPRAHEDDAYRAIRTGLGIVAALGILNRQLEQEHATRLAVRVGIHTGLVVVGAIGDGGRQEQLALGGTPNIAARLQNFAPPDTVVISEATWHLVQGYFTCYALGPRALRGLPVAMQVYQVLGGSAMQSRLDVAATRGLTPLVGREAEVALLRACWAQVLDGQGRLIALSGEAGIGKSRLVQVLKEHVADTPHTRLECRCSPYYQHTALYPLIDLVERLLYFQRDEAVEAKLTKLERALTQSRLALPETVPLFAALLSLALPEARYAPLSLTAERQKQKTLEALLALVLSMAAQHPVLLILEDLHWVDPSTLEFLNLLITQGPTAAILTLVTYRPDFQPPWGFRTHLTPLALQRLSPADVAAMATQVTGGKPLPPEILQRVVANTDGVPLFVEELTKTIMESGVLRETAAHYELAGPLPTLTIPTTLHDALMARLDRLNTVKAVAQLGATLGRTFAYDLFQAVTSLDAATLQQGLRQLVEAEILYQRGLPPRATYMFKHALIQEAAYQSLVKSTRQQYHQRIAQVLEAQFPDLVETQPEVLAHHCSEAGLNEQAVGYWQRAGNRVFERSAPVEAIAHLRKGLALLPTLPDTPGRARQELTLHIALGAALQMTRGHAHPEVEHTYSRARALCQQEQDTVHLIPVLLGLWRFSIVRAQLQKARELGEQLLHLAQHVQDPPLLVVAHYTLGHTMLWLGEWGQARLYLEAGVARYVPQKHHALLFRYGQDPGLACHTYLAWTLWVLGYPQQALERMRAALALAHTLAHPFSLAGALSAAALLHQARREQHVTQELAESAVALSTEQGLASWLAMGTLVRGWALATQGQVAEGMTQMQQGLAAWRAIGSEIGRPYLLALLTEVYEREDQVQEGMPLLHEALTLVEKTGERWWEAELHRLKGELLLQSQGQELGAGGSASDMAEVCFQQALQLARQQQAKSLELRAALSLSRLWQQQGKRQAAYALLAPVYGWFTEGFDTADLQEARALLEAL